MVVVKGVNQLVCLDPRVHGVNQLWVRKHVAIKVLRSILFTTAGRSDANNQVLFQPKEAFRE
jgi:hypothetical protein